jgi:intracellular multiplication protein IcmK
MKYIQIVTTIILVAFTQNVLSQSDAEAQRMLAQIKSLQPSEQTVKPLQLAQVSPQQLSPVPPSPPPPVVALPQLPTPARATTPVPVPVPVPVPAPQQAQAPPPPVSPMQLEGSLYQNIAIESEKKTGTSKFEIPYPQAQPARSIKDQIVGNKAFEGAVQGMLPMTPEQIHRLRQIYDAQQFAAAAAAGTPPRPTATSVYVNMSPGATPPVIRLADGFVTSMVFLDATGAPWPIEALDIGNPQVFNIQWDKKSNILMIQANTLYTYGNLAIRLRGLNTPVMLTLIPGQEIVDYRVDITVPGYGPEAKPLPIDTGLPPTETPLLLQVLDGIPPQGSKALTVMDELGQAWVLGEKMYLRTPYTLLSPGWLATMSSADGTNAYELQKAPMVLMAKNGKMMHVKIEGF